MKSYTYIMICPATKQQLTENEYSYSGGVCPKCGHNNTGTFTHKEKIVGWWEQPSLFNRLLGHRPKFHRKVT